MAPRRIQEYPFREFRVVVAENKGTFIAIGYAPNGEMVSRYEGETQEDAEVELKGELLKRSHDFIGVEEAIKVFLKAFPDGFQDRFYDYDERNYKVAAHRKGSELLSKTRLDQLVAEGDYEEVVNTARRTFTNLIFPNEAMKFADFAKSPGAPHERFARALRELLHGEDFDTSFDEIAGLLRPYGAAKWTILTYWPFVVHPDEHIFMKPEVAIECAWRLADEFGYQSDPSATIYRRYQAFAKRLRAGIAALDPRDYIDVQTFMYVVGKPGFVAGAAEARAKWMASRPA